MAKQIISRGSVANDGTGDNLRDGAGKINDNFNEIYTAIGDGSTVDGTIKIADDSSTVTTLSANGETLRVIGGTAITSTLSGNTLTIAADTASLITASGTATLTNKSIDLTDNTITGTLAEFNTAVSDATLVSTTSSDTLTNKTLTTPIISSISNTGTLTLPTSSDTLVGRDTTDTLTNKSISGSSNTFTNIPNSGLSNSSISITGDDSSAQTISLGGGILFTGGSGITTSVSGNEITFATDGSIVTETSTDTLTNKTISGASNTLSNIGNSSLTNSSLTIGADSISLGGTQTTITDLNLDGTSSLSGTGTIQVTSSDNRVPAVYANTGSFPAAGTYEGMFAYDTGGDNPYVADSGGWVKILTENGSIADLSNVGSIASITNGQVLVWNSSAGRFDPGNQTGSPSFTTDKSNTGDGSTTAFTITSGRTVDDILVIQNGIVLVPTDDYTVSGTTLTFVDAPAVNAEIVIRYLG